MDTIKKQSPTKGRQMRSPTATESSVALDRATQTDLDVDLNLRQELRKRIIKELRSCGIPKNKQVPYLASLTGRALQTVGRWIDEDKPGLPDLLSFALLCSRFDSDANWMLGLTQRRFPLPKLAQIEQPGSPVLLESRPKWLDVLATQVKDETDSCEIRYMSGDDMEPRIKRGAPMWVDTAATEIDENGVYLLEYQNRILVRQAEIRIGEGLLLSCENVKYGPIPIKDLRTAKKSGLKILGRVKMAIIAEKF